MKKSRKFVKADNPKAKQRELQASWEAILTKHSKPLFNRTAIAVKLKRKVEEPSNQTSNIETKVQTNPNFMLGSTAKIAPKVYTGTKMIGVATMHKSNLVPIFSEEEAIDVAQMRRN